MKRLTLAALAALSLSLAAPALASLSGPELAKRINAMIANHKAVQESHDWSILCQYPWADNWRISLNFPMPDALRGASQAELSDEAKRICCEVRQVIEPSWSCWYVKQ